jgi:hypothetical protein
MTMASMPADMMVDVAPSPEMRELFAGISELTQKLDAYYSARKACEYVIEHAEELSCPCQRAGKPRGFHENECPIGFVINALGEFKR